MLKIVTFFTTNLKSALNHDYCAFLTAQEILERCDELKLKDSFEFKLPFLIVSGTDDQLCKVEGSQTFYDNSPSTDKTIKTFPEARHELHSKFPSLTLDELPEVREELSKLYVDWILKRAI